jgi:hypothetical protein
MLPMLQSNFNYPLSGNVTQKIEPDWFFGTIDPEVGDSEIEKKIFLKVASYGKQIGMLTEVLLSIADELKLESGNITSLSELKELQAKVEAIKSSKQKRVKENAKIILDKLKACDPEGFKRLIREYREGR